MERNMPSHVLTKNLTQELTEGNTAQSPAIKIKSHREKFYAIFMLDGETQCISEKFNTQAAACIAGEKLVKHHQKGLLSTHSGRALLTL